MCDNALNYLKIKLESKKPEESFERKKNLFLLAFRTAMIPHNCRSWDCKGGYKFKKLCLSTAKDKELKTSLQTDMTFSHNVGLVFALEK